MFTSIPIETSRGEPHLEPIPTAPVEGTEAAAPGPRADTFAEADLAAQAALDLARDDARLLKLMAPWLVELRRSLIDDAECDPVRTSAREAMIAIHARLARIAGRDLPA